MNNPKIVIELNQKTKQIQVSHPNDLILSFGLMEFARISMAQKLSAVQENEPGGRIILPSMMVGKPPGKA